MLVLALSLQAAPSAPSAAPLSEVEGLRVQNLNLERVILERQLADWKVKLDKLRADLESARPGWSWNPDTGAFAQKPTKP